MNTLQINKIRQLDLHLIQLKDQIEENHTHENCCLIPHDSIQTMLSNLAEELSRQIKLLDEKEEVSSFFRFHFLEVLNSIEYSIQQFFIEPEIQFQQVTNKINSLLKHDQRQLDRKQLLLQERLQSLMPCLLQWQTCLPQLSDSSLTKGKKALSSLLQVVVDLPKSVSEHWNETALSCLQHQQEWVVVLTRTSELFDLEMNQRHCVVKAVMLSNEDRLDSDPQEYRLFLHQQLGVSLDELLHWHQEAIDETRNQVLTLASQIQGSPVTSMQQVQDLLNRLAGPCPNAQVMFERGNQYLKRVKSHCQTLFWLPEGERCELTGVPVPLVESFPWGGYHDGCPYERPLRGTMFLNDHNYTAVSDGWIKVNTIHEAYMGHHMQFLRRNSDPLPETMLRGPKSDAIIEGTAHRSEQLFENIFAEDPTFPLFTAFRRFHTAIRIKADLWLRYENRPIGEVVDLYQRELNFDEKTARGQVLAQENMLGYFTCYYYGLRYIRQWEKELNMDPIEMTRLLFSAGQISMKTLHRFLLCSEKARWSITHDFASLLKFA